MKTLFTLIVLASLGLWLGACEQPATEETTPAAEGGHTHADGSTHADHAEEEGHMAASEGDGAGEGAGEEDRAHDETPLEPAQIGDMTVELAQGHGAVAAGKESHLVVKLPYNDSGATTVRAWIGTEDRTLSVVGKGEYAPSHDVYNIHAVAPDPLPENTMWWIEIEKPDGTKVVGSAEPILE